MPIVCRGEPRGRTTMPADNGKSHERKLAAILAADVAGYSLLMADDELATVKALKEARTVFSRDSPIGSPRLAMMVTGCASHGDSGSKPARQNGPRSIST